MEEKYIMLPVVDVEDLLTYKVQFEVLTRVLRVVPSYMWTDLFKEFFAPEEEPKAEAAKDAEV